MEYNQRIKPKEKIPYSDSPIWFFGRELDPTEFENLYHRLLWVSYRYDFEPVSGWTSDSGWGCMIRTGQMILCNALVRLYFKDEDWIHGNFDIYLKIISLISDTPSSPFSLQNIAKTGEKYGKRVGQWFGPYNISCALKDLSIAHKVDLPFVFHISNESTIYLEDITDACKAFAASKEDAGDNTEVPIFLLLSTKLGVSSVNPTYLKSLMTYSKLPHSVGFIGGKPSSSYYFVGGQDDVLFYLDPHYNQPYLALPTTTTTTTTTTTSTSTTPTPPTNLDTYFCKSVNTLYNANIDESLAIGFLCTNFASLLELKEGMETNVEEDARLFWWEETRAKASASSITAVTEEGNSASGDDFSMDDF